MGEIRTNWDGGDKWHASGIHTQVDTESEEDKEYEDTEAGTTDEESKE